MSKKFNNLNLAEMGAVITVDELSQVLKISKSKSYELVKRDNFPKLKLGKRILIPIEPLKDWLNSNIGSSL